ncbi:MAG: helix-turn-helix domain-containing protein [Promethearchaeota archaeon]
MSPSQTAFENLLRRLREQQTESPFYDGKADLPLQTDGDRADFIRHVAALANNVEPSYLIIGVEDGTWEPIGLPENSPLRDSDRTQQQMNHILENRLDPNISIRYRTYEVADDVYGLVTIEGTSPPYIVAIHDREYGDPPGTQRRRYIHQGTIYFRHGANSVIAHRQSAVLEIVRKAYPEPDKFLEDCNYTNPESEDFGRHQLSERLVELHVKPTHPLEPSLEWRTARSWASFVFYPAYVGCEIETDTLKDKLRPDRQRIGRGPEWYHRLPEQFYQMFSNPQATSQEFLAIWQPLGANGISHFIRVRPTGHIEVGCTSPPFLQAQDGGRYFRFVALIGYLWQMVYQSKAIYYDAGFSGETMVLVNLVGTKETHLTDFAPRWVSPSSTPYQDYRPNVQTNQRLSLAYASDDEIEAMIRRIARDLGRYYSQDLPRCFTCDANKEFPHSVYVQQFC